VHSSDVPETFNMTKCLAVAFAIGSIGVGTLILLLLLADPTSLNFWHCEERPRVALIRQQPRQTAKCAWWCRPRRPD
jgi:hypothetical protein